MPLTLEAANDGVVKWYIDASIAVHHNMRSHTGITMTLGKGCPISSSTCQKINTKSSTEAKLVGVDDGMPLVVWTRNFLTKQGFQVNDNIVFQDNQSAMLLEKNGCASSSQAGDEHNTSTSNVFFVTDRVKNGELRIEYCPTSDMLADFFTKPLQGSAFRKFRALVMNLVVNVPLPLTTTGPQECVGTHSWADVVKRNLVRQSPGNDKLNNVTEMATSPLFVRQQ